MKKLMLMVIGMTTFCTSVFASQSSCGTPCEDVTRAQKGCVLNNFCHEKKLKKEIQALEQKKKELEEQLAAQQAKYEKLVFEVHHNLSEFISPIPSIKRNSMSIIAGVSGTALDTEMTSLTFKARTKPQPDLGLMYQHDFDRLRGSISATISGSVMVGAGLVF